MKLGLFAGTFDPIHEGHIAFAKAAAKQLGLDKVLMMPEPQPRGKKAITPFEHRLAMVELAIAGQPLLECFIHDAPQFTIDNTLPVIHDAFGDAKVYILLGADVFAGVQNWPQIEQHQTDLIFVVGRGAAEVPEPGNLHVEYVQHVQDLQSSSKIRSHQSQPMVQIRAYIADHKLYQ